MVNRIFVHVVTNWQDFSFGMQFDNMPAAATVPHG